MFIKNIIDHHENGEIAIHMDIKLHQHSKLYLII